MSSNYSLGGVGGFNSGFDVNGIISQLLALEQRPISLMTQKKTTITRQQTAYTAIQNKTRDLFSAIDKLGKRDIVTQKTMFENMRATSSDNKSVSATVTNNAAPQTLNVEVLTLPTSTVTNSTAGVSKFDGTMTNTELGITAGNFTLYTQVGATQKAYQVSITDGDTIGDILSDMQTAIQTDIPGATVGIVDGKIQINRGGAGNAVTFGAGGDTTNFLEKTFLNTAIAIDDVSGNTTTASQRVSSIDRDAAVTSADANLATTVNANSEFKINGVTFNADGKSINTLIDEINTSAAGVTANFNRGTNSFQLVAKTTGSNLISLEDVGAGNFLQSMNLINGTDAISGQVAGSNTQFKLNGQTMYATGDTIDETITGLTGVTLSLKKVAVGVTTQVTIQKDNDGLVNQVDDIIKKYNSVIDEIAKQTKIDPEATKTGATASNGPLAGDTQLKNFRNQLRSIFTQSVGGDLANTAFESLQMVGISSSPRALGAVEETETTDEEGDTETPTETAAATTATADGKLYLDKAALRAALALDPEKLKRLFIARDLAPSTPGIDDGLEGTFTKLQKLLSDKTYVNNDGRTGFGALYNLSNGGKGLFGAYQESSGKRVKSIDESIERANNRLVIKEKTLRQQFLAMDRMVGQYQQQGNALASLQTFR
ncbi:flagellar filament capping protein FliD [Vampirovibrio sp.]|uniref:flagellar filament capping protein FliD n=1 Tax=Vampirovibrio sp. TaxID=2717857 RepID=UPI00359419C5